MSTFLHPTTAREGESPQTATFYAVATVVVALALFAAAMGDGSPDTSPEDKLPAWVDAAANLVSAAIGVGVLVPRTRGAACVVAVMSMLLSMGANYAVDGPDFFWKALPFNLVTGLLAAAVAQRHLRR